ncbi:hypothetical protein GCM10009689_10410 [Brevibacterium antiquum]|uniref:DUF6480 family protein n=1 Tax=Brevibacterium antiquum TaxID=234835 RepID=UPI0018DF003A|nr:DUF6480 family protein [Brevibacterium antiquum]
MNSRNDRTPDSSKHTTGNPNLDPDPSGDPDLDGGGSVQPGATPPESNSATASPLHPPDRRPPRTKWVFVGVGAILAIIIMVFVAYAVGLFS